MSITADYHTLMRQASMTAAEYMSEGADKIDAMFGDGYAKKHPELLAAFMTAAALDYGAAAITKGISSAIEDLAVQVKYLGNGDAATTVGAIEFLGHRIGNAIEILAGAAGRDD